MKLLLVTDVFPPGSGGSGESTAALASALLARSHEPAVLTLSKNDGERNWQGARVYEVRRGRKKESVARLSSRLAEIAAEERIELIHAQHWRSMAAASLADTGIPLVVTVRDYWPVCQWSTKMVAKTPCPECNYWNRVRCIVSERPELFPAAPLMPAVIGFSLRQRRSLLRQANAVVAVSQAVANTLPGPCEVIPNLLESKHFALHDTETELEKVGTPSHEPELPERFTLFVGKLEPNKGADRLVSIYSQSGLDIPLLVAGSGSLEGEIRAQADQSSKDIRLLGWVGAERLRRVMRLAELIVFPSRWEEPLSRVLLEALAVGAVVVAEPTGGTRDIIIDGESGLLAQGNEELASAMTELFAHPERAHRLRIGARQRAKDVFSDRVVIPKLEALYERLVNEHESTKSTKNR